MSLSFYNIDNAYVSYLSQFEPHLFHNKKSSQQNERKYIGILFSINQYEYFAPLSSFKPKHSAMKETIDLIKVGNYAVINLNNMFPVVPGCYSYVDFSLEKDVKYKQLLQSEYRIIRHDQSKIIGRANTLYKIITSGSADPKLVKRCNDFKMLEQKYDSYTV